MKKTLFSFTTFLTGLVISFNCYSFVPLRFIKMDNRNGFSSDYLTDIIQDKEGFLWITSMNGINRYDGYELKIFKPGFKDKNGFTNHEFKAVTIDKEDNYWFATLHSGINVYNKKTGEVRAINTRGPANQTILHDFVNDVFCDSKGRIWISTDGGLNMFHPKENRMFTYTEGMNPGKNNPKGAIYNVYEDSKGQIFICSAVNGLYLFEDKLNDFINFRIPSVYSIGGYVNRIHNIVEDSNGTYWIGTWGNGLFQTEISIKKGLTVLRHLHDGLKVNSLKANLITCLYKSRSGAILIGTTSSLHILNNPESTDEKLTVIEVGEGENQISNGEITQIFEDRSGILWFTTAGGGLNKVDAGSKQFTTHLIVKNGIKLDPQIINSFYNNPNGDLMVGVQGVGFGKYSIEKEVFTHYLNLFEYRNLPRDLNTAICFFKDSKGLLWIGERFYGVYLVDEKSGKVAHYSNLENVSGFDSRRVNVIQEDPMHNVWVGTESGLYKFVRLNEPDKFQVFRFLSAKDNPYSISGDYINSLYFDSNRTLWVTTNNGLSKLETPLKTNFPLVFKNYSVSRDNSNGLRSNMLYSMHEDELKRFWIGTGGEGLALFDRENEKFTHFSRNVGLKGDAIYDIIPGKDNSLWLTSDQGLIKFSYKNNKKPVIESYTYEDGLQGNIFLPGSSHKDSQGNIYIGGYHGFNSFNPEKLQLNQSIPEMAFTKIETSNNEVNIFDALENGLNITHKDKSFSIGFTALSYSQPTKNMFSYILEGFDQDWSIVNYTGRTVTYKNVPPGDYTFKVIASNSSDLWNVKPLELKITVKPHPFETWWAFTFYGLVFFAILFWIYYILINNTKIKHSFEIEKLERIKEENINEFKFRFFTNISHELLTPLSIISCSVEDLTKNLKINKENLHVMSNNVNRLLRLITQLLDYRKMETNNMMPLVTKIDINLFFREICDSFQPFSDKKFITTYLNGEIEEEIFVDPEKLEKIISNLLSNAFKYTPEYGKIFFFYKLVKEDSLSWLCVEIIDSGQGIHISNIQQIFDRFYRVKSITGKTFGTGIGLALTKNLVEVHKGVINVENDATYGAKFSFKIPVSEEAYSEDQIADETGVYLIKEFSVGFGDSSDSSAESGVPTPSVKGTAKILVVEDNIEFRRLIANYLSYYFEVFEASNGVEGYELAIKESPDLIISDVMMPEMDGIELCQKIKNNIETSDILVILLTAKVGDEARFQSYKSGADSYIPKPVSFKVLHARIDSLIDLRQQIIKRFSSGIMPEIKEINISGMDNNLLKMMKTEVEKNISDPDLNVNRLSEKLQLSSSMLYRKLTKLTGMSPVEFIRNIRVEHSAQLLKSSDSNVSEAAYNSGFNDLSYFTKCFKNHYGVTPKNYKKKYSE